MVAIERIVQTQEPLQQPVDAGGPEQVLAADDVGDALQPSNIMKVVR